MADMTMAELKYRLRDFFYFTPTERRETIIAILVMTFVFAYNDGQETFQLAYWIMNFLKVLVIVIIAVVLHISVQKIASLYTGFRAEFKLWSVGVYLTILVTILTKGKFYLLLIGGITFYQMVMLRIGHFRYGLNLRPSGFIAGLGPLSNLVIATFWETLALNNIYPELFHQMTIINLFYAFYSMLPIPNLDGFNMFYGSRLLYAFFFSFVMSYLVLYLLGIYSLIWPVFIAIVCYILFWLYFERTTQS